MNIDAKPWYPGCGHGAFPTSNLETLSSTSAPQGGVADWSELPVFPRQSSEPILATMRSRSDVASPCDATDLHSVASSASLRRNDPYRSSASAAAAHAQTPASHQAVCTPTSVSSNTAGVYDYSDAMYRFMVARDVMEGPPSYHDFVALPSEGCGAPAGTSQPYRSAKLRRNHPINIPLPCDAVDTAVDDAHGTSASGSHSGDSGSATPSGAHAQQKHHTHTSPNTHGTAGNIPLPRSRRTDSQIHSATESPVVTNETCDVSKTFPPVDMAGEVGSVLHDAAATEDSYLRSVSSAMRGPIPPPAVTVDPTSVEVLVHNAGFSADTMHALGSCLESGGKPFMSAAELEQQLLRLPTGHRPRCIPVAVNETPKKLPPASYAACLTSTLTSTQPAPQLSFVAPSSELPSSSVKSEQKKQALAPKPAPQKQPAASSSSMKVSKEDVREKEAAPAPKIVSEKSDSAASGKKPCPKKKDSKDQWKTVEGKSTGTAKSQAHSQPATTHTAPIVNKFELVATHSKKSKKSAASVLVASDSSDDEIIVIAPSAPAAHSKKKHPAKQQHIDDDEAWLEEVAKAGAAAQEQQRNELAQQGFLKEPLLFMGFLKLVHFPTLGALLVSPGSEEAHQVQSTSVTLSPMILNAAELLLKTMREAAVDAIHGRINTIRRLLLKMMKPNVVSQCPALVICALVEACDACVDYDLGLSYVRQALHLARTNRLLPLELLSMFVLSRHTQKLIDGTDCMEETQAALRLAMVLEEPFAIGWISQTLAVYLELAGSFHESLRWHYFAHRVAKANGDARLETESLTHIAIATTAVGNMEEATALLNEADEKRKLLTRAASQRIVLNMTQVCAQSGDLERALQFHLEDRDVAKANADAAQAATSSDSIATLRRSMGQLELSQQEHQEALQWIAQCPHTREVDCLLSLSATYKQLGHYGKARDVLLKVLRTARETGEQSTAAKCMAEIAECDGVEGHFQDAVCRLSEGLRLVDQTSPTDLKQYFIKVNLCEAEWKLLDVLEKIHFERGMLLEAIRFGDVMRIPNTAEVMTMMQRRQRKALPNWPTGHVTSSTSTNAVAVSNSAKGSKAAPVSRSSVAFAAAEAFLNQRFLDTALLDGLMNDRELGGLDCMVVFSLRWDDDLDLTAYVVHGNRDGKPSATPQADGSGLVVKGRRLRLTPELVQLLIGQRSALFHLFHSRHTDATGDEIYFDTPLFPQRFWYVQNKFHESEPERSNAIATKVDTCLELLYDGLIRPLEDLFPAALTGSCNNSDGNAMGAMGGKTPRVLFVGDGVISMIPFPALRDGKTGQSLVDKWITVKLPSVQHALTIYAKRVARKQRSAAEPASDVQPANSIAPSLVTGTELSDSAPATSPRALLGHAFSEFSAVVTLCSDDEPHIESQPSLKEISELSAPSSTVSLAERLLASSTTTRQRHVRLSNTLMRALTMDLPRSAPVILDLPVVPDVKEDFSGILTSSKGTMLATSADIAVTWDLSSMPLVVATQFGAYASRAVHETGIPIYRALLIAEAQRLILPTGSSLRHVTEQSMRAVVAAIHAADRNPTDAMHQAMKALKASGASIETWCAFAVYGLP